MTGIPFHKGGITIPAPMGAASVRVDAIIYSGNSRSGKNGFGLCFFYDQVHRQRILPLFSLNRNNNFEAINLFDFMINYFIRNASAGKKNRQREVLAGSEGGFSSFSLWVGFNPKKIR